MVYFVLQKWYKTKYEKHLFQKGNDLYNIISYINGAKEKGFDHEKIKSNLKKAGWKDEQIDYALKKYSGKRTGMWSPFKNSSKKSQETQIKK